MFAFISTDGTKAELTIREDDKRRFIQFDESEHKLRAVCEEGGPRARTWTNPDLPRMGTPSFRGSSHITGLYGTNAGGESMPPVYIFSTSAQDAENFQIKAHWADGLPTVRGYYGKDTIGEYPSYVCVRKSGCTDHELIVQLFKQVYLPLYPNRAKVAKRDNTGRLIEGPIVPKEDGGH